MADTLERIESLKAGTLAASSVLLTYGIATLGNKLVLAQFIETPDLAFLLQVMVGVNLLVSGGIAWLSGFLFGITYRYIIREDDNPQLKAGAVLAFGLVRGLAQVEVGLNFPGAFWALAVLSTESILLFAIARLTLDWAFCNGWALRLFHLNRQQSPIINRIRQDLAWQFPEAAKIGLNATLFWGWLAAERKSAKYDSLLKNSIGLGLETEMQRNAKALWEIHQRELFLEREMRSLLSDARFLPYRKVFAEFGFEERVEALLLSQIYPLENYLVDGKPEIRIRKGKNSGKPTKRHLSLRRFQKALGTAPTREDSGDKHTTKKAGSALCRTALWQWIFTRIEPQRMRTKVAAKASVMLFQKLVSVLEK